MRQRLTWLAFSAAVIMLKAIFSHRQGVRHSGERVYTHTMAKAPCGLRSMFRPRGSVRARPSSKTARYGCRSRRPGGIGPVCAE